MSLAQYVRGRTSEDQQAHEAVLGREHLFKSLCGAPNTDSNTTQRIAEA
jgi:DNA-binding phage protein